MKTKKTPRKKVQKVHKDLMKLIDSVLGFDWDKIDHKRLHEKHTKAGIDKLQSCKGCKPQEEKPCEHKKCTTKTWTTNSYYPIHECECYYQCVCFPKETETPLKCIHGYLLIHCGRREEEDNEPRDCPCDSVMYNEFNKVVQCHRCGTIKMPPTTPNTASWEEDFERKYYGSINDGLGYAIKLYIKNLLAETREEEPMIPLRQHLEVLAKAIDKFKKIRAEERKAVIKQALDIALEAMEPCEPDCTPIRHARHEGSWNTYREIQEKLKKLDERS